MLIQHSLAIKMAAEYERVELVKPQVFVYQLPPRASNRAVRAEEWNLSDPSWKGRLRIVSVASKCLIKLEDKHSGELFAQCPVDAFPGVAVEPVSDSSRYFILRLQDPSGHHAFVGLGFEDRGDSFDFNVALQDHFKHVKQDQQIAKEEAAPQTHKDYSLKAGEKIQINLGKSHSGGGASKPKSAGDGVGFLPPPPAAGQQQPPGLAPPPSSSTGRKEDWGDFASFGSKDGDSKDANWVEF